MREGIRLRPNNVRCVLPRIKPRHVSAYLCLGEIEGINAIVTAIESKTDCLMQIIQGSISPEIDRSRNVSCADQLDSENILVVTALFSHL